jgi:hypothetical protein
MFVYYLKKIVKLNTMYFYTFVCKINLIIIIEINKKHYF